MPPLHIRGVFLPDDTERDIYVVGDRVTFEPVQGAETVADRGYVVPGLVDAHCHIGIAQGAIPVESIADAKQLALVNRAAGVLALRDAGSPIEYPELDDDPEVPRLVRAGRHLAATRRYLPGFAVECGPDELSERVIEQAKVGNGWVKLVGDWIDRDLGDLGPSWDTATVANAVLAAHEVGVRVAVHVFGEAGVQAAVEAGVDSVEHGCGLDPDLVDRMAEAGMALVPTMLNVAETFDGIAGQAESKFPGYAEHMRRLQRGFPDVVRAAHEAGVPIYAGSDAGGGIAHGRVAEEALLLHHRAGLSATDALAAASWASRDWLGLGGLVEDGPADLVVYDDDPRVDLRVLEAPRRIVLRGAVVGGETG